MTDPASAAARELFPHENSAVHDPVATVIRRHYAPLVERERRLRQLLLSSHCMHDKINFVSMTRSYCRWTDEDIDGIIAAFSESEAPAALSPTEGTP